MHELSVMAYLLESVEEQAQKIGATKVTAINLVIGERTSIVDDSLLYYFDMLTPGTVAEGAQLAVRRTTMRFHCAGCDADYHPTGFDFQCPNCNTVGAVTSDGSELLIESLEIET
ncbi:MAG: hydrogenase maturation nickel metallochaperone HypA [Chloroflexota bacterium]|nr:hydrogenase maturation nickel metallochaperone HypA [Chloroflexota bacterium]